jgi:hypothetical protein
MTEGVAGSAGGVARAARRSRLALVSSRRHFDPCRRFSRTRLIDVLHRRHSAPQRRDAQPPAPSTSQRLGVRLIFVHLFLIALVTYFGRRRILESVRWEDAHQAEDPGAAKRRVSLTAPFREVLSPQGRRAIMFCLGLYLFWNLMAGTNGFTSRTC